MRWTIMWAALALATGCDDGASEADDTADGAPLDAAAEADMASDAAPDATPDAAPDPCRIEPPPAVEPALATALDEALAAAFEDAGATGIAALVVMADGRGWAGAVGRDDTRGEAPLPPWSRFRIASITKTVVAAAVMGRVDAGAWSLDDPVTDWVDDFDLDPGVTLRTLLGHTSGIFNYTDDASFLLRRMEHLSPAEVVAFALMHETGLLPGEAWLYSNTGYFLLGMALEALEQRPLEAILRADVIDPVGMAHTWLEQFEPPPGGCDIGQGHVTFNPEITEGFDAGWVWAAGGLAAPTADLCRWLGALFGGEVLPMQTVEAMSVPTAQSMGAEDHFSYGLGIMQAERGGRPVAGHTGSTMGFRGEVFFDRESGACVAVQTNDFTARQIPVADALWSVLPR